LFENHSLIQEASEIARNSWAGLCFSFFPNPSVYVSKDSGSLHPLDGDSEIDVGGGGGGGGGMCGLILILY
jgi:hypothetical protein